LLDGDKRAIRRTTGTSPVQTIAGMELVSGLITELIAIITVEIAEMTKQIASIFLVFDNGILSFHE